MNRLTMDSFKFAKTVPAPIRKMEPRPDSPESTEEARVHDKQRKPIYTKPALTPLALKWLNSLSEDVRPVILPEGFPHIVNLIAQHWPLPINCNRYLDQLTIRQREGRQGFPPDVFSELIKLSILCKRR